jgi:hypothetical protein
MENNYLEKLNFIKGKCSVKEASFLHLDSIIQRLYEQWQMANTSNLIKTKLQKEIGDLNAEKQRFGEILLQMFIDQDDPVKLKAWLKTILSYAMGNGYPR